MEKIYLFKEQLKNFKLLCSDTYESKIYLDESKDIVYKIFTSHDKDYLENKRQKCMLLGTYDEAFQEEFITPISLVYVDYAFAGYASIYRKNMERVEDLQFEKRNFKIDLLKEAKKKVILLHENGITACDLNFTNFLYRNGKMVMGDLDNTAIGSYSCDVLTGFGKKYLNYNPIDDYFDVFLFNIITIGFLMKTLNYHVLNNLRKYGAPFKDEALRIECEKLMKYNERYKGKYLIDQIESPKQIKRRW